MGSRDLQGLVKLTELLAHWGSRKLEPGETQDVQITGVEQLQWQVENLPAGSFSATSSPFFPSQLFNMVVTTALKRPWGAIGV